MLNFNLYMVRCIGRSERAGGLNGIKYCVLQNTLKYHKIITLTTMKLMIFVISVVISISVSR